MTDVRFSDLCHFTDAQWRATHAADSHRYTLFGGSRGPGKSFWLRWYLLRFVLYHHALLQKPVDVMLACEDYPSLIGRQVTKIETEFPAWLGSLRSSGTKGFGFHLRNGSSILLRNLDDASKYQSAEFAAIGVDELTRNSERTFNILRASLRWPGVAETRFVGATNPDANWVRRYWVEKRLPVELADMADEFAFVAAMPGDNPHLSETYWQELNTLSGALRKAWLLGDWYAGVEGLVLENFTDDNVTEEEPDTGRPFELAIDDGYIDPRATLFIQRQGNGDVLVFDELYETKTLEEQSIANIKAVCERHGLGLPELAAVSHEAVALRNRLRSADIPARNWLAVKAGAGESTRVQAIHLTRALICDGQGYRALRVHRRCVHLLDEIRSGWHYPDGKSGVNEHPADGNDHACDALTSWVWMRMRRS
jgi:hypothetical protein